MVDRFLVSRRTFLAAGLGAAAGATLCRGSEATAAPSALHRYQDYGGTYTETLFRDWQPQLEYVKVLVAPLAADPNVLAWDLCNEPQAFDLNFETSTLAGSLT